MAPKYHVLPISGAIAHNELVYQFIVYSTISSHIKFYNEVSPGVSENMFVYEMSLFIQMDILKGHLVDVQIVQKPVFVSLKL